MTQVKICGPKRVEDALVAVDAGADLVGLMFFKGSKRAISPDTAAEIAAAIRGRAKSVGVFVNAGADDLNRLAAECGLDYVQLSGSESEETIRALNVPAIDVIHMRPEISTEDLIERAEQSPAEIILLDTARAGEFGGTGEVFDWGRVPTISKPLMLAGGLHPENVAEAVRTVRPWGVDVSSGVEVDGEKSHEQIRLFVSAVRSALTLTS
jgi:phosphoribosylanthranilate isomerase